MGRAEATRRVALVLPHTDITLEADLQRHLPGEFVVHTQRMWLDGVTPGAEQAMVDREFPEALRYLSAVPGLEAAVFGCTSAAAVYGPEGDRAIAARISRELGCRPVTALEAAVKALRTRHCREVALLTPYTGEVNAVMADVLHRLGVTVTYSAGLGLTSDEDNARVRPPDLLALVEKHREAIRAAGGCFLSCTNIPAVEVRAELEKGLEVPVVTSNQAIIESIVGNCGR